MELVIRLQLAASKIGGAMRAVFPEKACLNLFVTCYKKGR